MVEPADGPLALHQHPFPGIFPQVPVRPPGTCGGTPPAAASPAHVLSGALQGGHKLSVTNVGTPGQRAPPEPHNAVEQGGSIPTTPHKAGGASALRGERAGGLRGALLSQHAPCRASVCALLRASNCSSSSSSFLFSTWEAGR